MKGYELTDHINGNLIIRDHYLGVLGAEEAKQIKTQKSRTFAIINTEKTKEEGRHWFCAIKCEGPHLEIFDSLGCTKDTVKARFGRLKSYAFNESPLQPPESPNCGKFAAYFAFVRLTNYDEDFCSVINDYFSDDLNQNDVIVTDWWLSGEVFDPNQNTAHPAGR